MENLNAKPRDMNAIPGYSDDKRVIGNLINKNNNTTKDENMWMVPFIKGQNHFIYFTFTEPKRISGIRVWNFNKSIEDSYRGAKMITIAADNCLITPQTGILIKKAPGTDFFDFSQYIGLPYFDGWSPETVRLYSSTSPQMGPPSIMVIFF